MGGANIHGRILVLGTDGAGKTTFLNRYEHPQEDIPVKPTVAYKVRVFKVKGVTLNVWDVSGKESTRSLWKHYYKEGRTDAIIWVVDSSASEESIEESRDCLEGAMMDPALSGKRIFSEACVWQ